MTVEQFIDEVAEKERVSRYNAAHEVLCFARSVMDAERQNRAAELRADIDRGKAAEKELAAIGAPGRPRKKRNGKRKDLEAPITA